MEQRAVARRMQVFIIIWLGQLVSLVGSGLTSFALGVWVYQRTGSVTDFSLISLFTTLPLVLASPVAGAFVDRWDRRKTMFYSDLGAGLSTITIAWFLFFGQLELWHIYLATAVSSICKAFQWPAYTAASTTLVPKEHLHRVGGLAQMGQSVAELVSPVLAGILVVTIQIQGVLLLDFCTFSFALITLLLVKFPKHKITTADSIEKFSLLRNISYGWNYITARPGLLGLQMFFAATNFLQGVVEVLATPLILSFVSPAVAGIMLSIGGSGMLFGSVVMSIWRGPKRRINSVFGFLLLNGLSMIVAGLRASSALFTLAVFLFCYGLPIINGSNQLILQQKVPLDLQGRVFALSKMISGVSFPVAYLVAGPLADFVFEPLMAVNGPLAGSIGQVIGIGKGRGIGLLFIVMGTLTMMATVVAYQYPRLRRVEDELPDIQLFSGK
ncbi:MFS transporter [aff. Roholtiella sp. LEGE 12411]|uniref:MFS transporter n=1 Tax=aff. Roholtiella sp. LEGE 12411 TaxID=1828822 RepID=UPI00187EAC77|nr:MFS transporter [aff. Roholtiella sp. LEGE 12411]MBE9034357.1 MFS transporter [aff. Roholtiella sp. LEGE 12411]